jgi:hypothetical protein
MSLSKPVARATVFAQIALALAISAFLVLKLYALRPTLTDEGVWFYSALLVARGAVPYSDFFCAHPPLHLAIDAITFLAHGGFDLAAGRALLALSGAVQVVCVYAVVRRIAAKTSPWIREASALAGAVILLLSLSFLVTTTFDTGVAQASAFATLAALLALHGRRKSSGIALGVAVTTALPVVPLAVAIAGGTVLAGEGARDRRRRWDAAIAFALTVLGVHASALALAGHDFVAQVYGFPLAKVRSEGDAAGAYAIVGDSWWLVVGALVGILALVSEGGRALRWLQWFGAAGTCHVVATSLQARVFYYYGHPLLAPAAALAGCGIASVANGIAARGSAAIGERPLGRTTLAAIAAVVSLVLFVHRDVADASPRAWSDAPLLGARGNAVVRALFWRDVPGPRDGAVTRYLRRVATVFPFHEAMVDAVRRERAAHVGTSIFGDSLATPLVALDAHVPIAGNVVDTNVQRFEADPTLLPQVIRLLEATPDAIVIASDDVGLGALPEFESYLRERYEPIARFTGDGAPGDYALYRRLGLAVNERREDDARHHRRDHGHDADRDPPRAGHRRPLVCQRLRVDAQADGAGLRADGFEVDAQRHELAPQLLGAEARDAIGRGVGRVARSGVPEGVGRALGHRSRKCRCVERARQSFRAPPPPNGTFPRFHEHSPAFGRIGAHRGPSPRIAEHPKAPESTGTPAGHYESWLERIHAGIRPTTASIGTPARCARRSCE